MSRTRLAAVLAVLASLALLGTAALAVTTYVGQDADASTDRDPPHLQAVRDPRTGASFEVPADWQVKDQRVRIYYADRHGRPAAVVRGPAVYREGYCSARPKHSNRGFVGFTRQDFETWTNALARSDGVAGGWSTGASTTELELADGSTGRMTSSELYVGDHRPCSAPGVAVSMVEAAVEGRSVRLVLVRDTTRPGTLSDGGAVRILRSLRPSG